MIDWQFALARVGGNKQVLQEMIDVFQQDSEALLKETADALRQQDGQTLHRTAHTLKGMISFFGVTSLADLALTLEQCGAENDFAEAQVKFDMFSRDIERFQVELSRRQTSS